jgi:hypothetical protein
MVARFTFDSRVVAAPDQRLAEMLFDWLLTEG